MLQVLIYTLPEMAAWVFALAAVGLGLGVVLLMVALRWMLPWAELKGMRQKPHGWTWLVLQWTWVTFWCATLPTLGMLTGALTGCAFGARTLMMHEQVGQVLGEQVLAPVSSRLAAEISRRNPGLGDVAKAEMEIPRIEGLLLSATPEMVNQALDQMRQDDEAQPAIGAMERAGRHYTRALVRTALGLFFESKRRIVNQLTAALHKRCAARNHKARLDDVVACCSNLFFTPAFASWTFSWLWTHALALLPVLLLLWLTPWGIFKLFWWWRSRRLKSFSGEPALDLMQKNAEGTAR